MYRLTERREANEPKGNELQISLSHIAILLTLIGCTISVLSYRKKQFVPTEIVELKGDLGELQGQVSVLEKQMGLFWGVVEKQMSQLLHSPHRPRLDQLLDKNTRGESLTDREADQLVNLLQKLIESKELSSEEVSWATLLMAVTVAKYRLE